MSATGIDLFAGAGGFTTGAQAAGLHILWAGNHWDEAVHTHEWNHPDVQHAQEDLHRTDWTQVPRHDVLLASPACQGHSRARGKDKPKHEALRATAWCVVQAAEVHKPQCILVENVAEFLTWNLYPAWRQALELMGYHVVAQVLDAADFGVPQRRRRAFITAHLAAPLHLVSPDLPHQPASSIIEWDHPGARSLSERSKPHAERTLACIAHGEQTYGDRFLVPFYSSERKARDPEKPLGTLTTNNHFGVYNKGTFRMLSVDEMLAGMGFPKSYYIPNNTRVAIKLIGNAVCPPKIEELVGQVLISLR